MLPEKQVSRSFVKILAVAFVLLTAAAASAGTVVIKPGQFDHFTLQMPEQAVAGENVVIKASVYDANNNLITNFSEAGKEFRVEVGGIATAQPSVLGASAFSGGVANILVNGKKAERVTFSIREAGGTVPVISRELLIVPNKLDHFILQAPQSVTAGIAFDVKAVAKDTFDNTVSDIDIGKGVKITSSGSSAVKTLGSGTPDFRSGLTTISFVSEKAGDVVIEMQDVVSGSLGRTPAIQIQPGALASFKLQAPKTAVAGEPFELLVAAYDAFQNLVAGYASTGSGVRLATTGSSKIEPSMISPSEFKNGQATVRIAYEKAEEIQISVREANREQSGTTADIRITNAEPDHFVVLTPDTAVSGAKFKIKIEAYDRFNNLVRNFNLIGNDVLLTTTGSGTLSPAKVSPPDFVNGVAVTEVTYDKAESFQISARMANDRGQGRMTVGDGGGTKQVAARREPVVEKKAEHHGTQQAPAAKKPERSERKAAPEATAGDRTKVVPKNEPVRKAAVPAEAPKKKADIAEPPKKAVEKPVAVKKVPSGPLPEKKAVEKKQEVAAAPPATASVPPPVKPEIYTVSKVSIIEAKDKAMLVVNITNPNGHLTYGDEIVSKLGREWLKVHISPAVNSTEKSFKFKSAFIGDVLVEGDAAGAQNVVNLFIELIPAGLTYDIARVKNTLVLTFSNP